MSVCTFVCNVNPINHVSWGNNTRGQTITVLWLFSSSPLYNKSIHRHTVSLSLLPEEHSQRKPKRFETNVTPPDFRTSGLPEREVTHFFGCRISQIAGWNGGFPPPPDETHRSLKPSDKIGVATGTGRFLDGAGGHGRTRGVWSCGGFEITV